MNLGRVGHGGLLPGRVPVGVDIGNNKRTHALLVPSSGASSKPGRPPRLPFAAGLPSQAGAQVCFCHTDSAAAWKQALLSLCERGLSFERRGNHAFDTSSPPWTAKMCSQSFTGISSFMSSSGASGRFEVWTSESRLITGSEVWQVEHKNWPCTCYGMTRLCLSLNQNPLIHETWRNLTRTSTRRLPNYIPWLSTLGNALCLHVSNLGIACTGLWQERLSLADFPRRVGMCQKGGQQHGVLLVSNPKRVPLTNHPLPCSVTMSPSWNTALRKKTGHHKIVASFEPFLWKVPWN